MKVLTLCYYIVGGCRSWFASGSVVELKLTSRQPLFCPVENLWIIYGFGQDKIVHVAYKKNFPLREIYVLIQNMTK